MRRLIFGAFALVALSAFVTTEVEFAHADEQIEDYATGSGRRASWDRPGRLGPISVRRSSVHRAKSSAVRKGPKRANSTHSHATIKPSHDQISPLRAQKASRLNIKRTQTRNLPDGAFTSYAKPDFKDGSIRASVGALFALLEGSLGALIMVVAGIVAVVAAAMG